VLGRASDHVKGALTRGEKENSNMLGFSVIAQSSDVHSGREHLDDEVWDAYCV
jgi:hypothetical protein